MNRLYWLLFFLLIYNPVQARRPIPPSVHTDPVGALQAYQQNLAKLRQEHINHRELPDLKFFLFGMGNRLKLIYRNGRLQNALTGNIEKQWQVKSEIIVPSEYLVHLTLANGQTVQIREDETGVWILDQKKRPKLIRGTRSPVNLPRFANSTYGPLLRVLHQEVLVNIIKGKPIPNFLVYHKPWYRHASLIAMVLKETNNLSLIRDWIMALRDPFDRANQGKAEADNPGEVLFLVSLVADKTHPVVQMALDSVRRFRKDNYILGNTDNAEHPVFQTNWLKYGLQSLGLPDPYTVPKLHDGYSSLCWWNLKDQQLTGKRVTDNLSTNDPYLAWAEDHFAERSGVPEKQGMVGNLDYPLTWEQNARNAHYPGMTVLDMGLAKQKLAFPYAPQAAEMFLLLSTAF